MLVGREDERRRLQALLAAARAGRSGALLLRGPAGIGKTALLRWAEASAGGFAVLRARGIQAESGIPFAGLAELVAPLLELLDDIPPVQAGALRGALALAPGTAADRFTVPAALLSLLARAAEDAPLLVIVDDSQWLDEASIEAFLFAGRRLDQEGVAILAAPRADAPPPQAPWLESLAVAPLADAAARALLGAEIAPGVADRLLQTAAGNPLALLEIPGLLSAGQLAGREPLEDPLRPGTGVERAFAVAVAALPAPARRALLVAAAAGTRRPGGDGGRPPRGRPAPPGPGGAGGGRCSSPPRRTRAGWTRSAARSPRPACRCATWRPRRRRGWWQWAPASSSSAIPCCARPSITVRRRRSGARPTARWPRRPAAR